MKPEHPSLARRNDPSQDRSTHTFNLILQTTGSLLAEVGLDGMSTNLICKRAGLTPPALYRYFPNKHAVLKQLGERLVREQNAGVAEWLESGYDAADLAGSFLAMLRGQVRITRSEPGAAWVLRALRASPILIDVRLATNSQLAAIMTTWALQRWTHLDQELALRHFRLAIELGYAAIEMVVDQEFVEGEILVETARILAWHHADFLQRQQKR